MKRLVSVTFILFLVYGIASPQSCLPEGITFINQVQIDNFQTNYPDCTEIEGNVEITGGNITNLYGLNVLTAIGGGFSIPYSIALTSLTGLDNVTSIGGNLDIVENNALTSLTGLDNVTSIGGDLVINDNDVLTSIMGLENVTSIGGDLVISDNDALTSLTGLDNIDAVSIDDLHLYDNSSLSTCEVQSICDYLVSPNGTVNIYSNATGCNNPFEVANACGVTLPCLPYGNYYFFTQTEIDDFQTNYPGCTEIEGNVIITESDITNLNGLNVLTSIGGNLDIVDNDALTGLTGLEGLTYIGASLTIWDNAALTSLTGLEGLTSTGKGLWISRNDVLTNLTGLENVTSIGKQLLVIANNTALTSLTGLDNIDHSSISKLYIQENNNLSTCEVQSICDYLINPTGVISIFNNATGCNSPEEVEEACELSVESINPEDDISIFPNPANRQMTISSKDGRTIKEVIIYNQTGQIVYQEKPVNNIIDISELQPGMYIIEVVSGLRKIREKLMIEKF